MNTKPLDWIALTLIIIGAVNCGIIGFFQYDLIAALFGGISTVISRIIFALIGLSGLYCLSIYGRLDRTDSVERYD